MTREEAYTTIKENLCAMCAYGSQCMELCDIRSCDNRDAIKALEQEPIKPTVESRPVIHANWLSGDCKGAHCSNCEEYTPFVYGAYNFCPNCGADMREAKE